MDDKTDQADELIAEQKPSNHNKSYSLTDVLVIYLIPPSDKNAQALADFLGRTPTAIEFIWRQIEEGSVIGPSKSNKIQEHIEFIERIFPRTDFQALTRPEAKTSVPVNRFNGIKDRSHGFLGVVERIRQRERCLYSEAYERAEQRFLG